MRRTLEGIEFSDRGIKLMMFVWALAAGVFTLGVSYATARAALNEKADVVSVLQIRTALALDSLRNDARANQLQRMEVKIDSVNNRITQLVCYRSANPACR